VTRLPFMVLLLGGLLCPSPADAIPLLELWERGAEIKIETWFGTLTQNEEDVANIKLLNERRAQQGLPPLPVPPLMGQAYTNDDLSAHTQPGQSVVLSYQLLDINTGLPVAADPFGIASVRYDGHLDLSLPPTFSFLGTSSDSANNFAFDWVVSGFEPMIKATPLDAAGREIQIIGPDNDNTLIGTGFQYRVAWLVWNAPAAPI
jgi:hypothetical protein